MILKDEHVGIITVHVMTTACRSAFLVIGVFTISFRSVSIRSSVVNVRKYLWNDQPGLNGKNNRCLFCDSSGIIYVCVYLIVSPSL